MPSLLLCLLAWWILFNSIYITSLLHAHKSFLQLYFRFSFFLQNFSLFPPKEAIMINILVLSLLSIVICPPSTIFFFFGFNSVPSFSFIILSLFYFSLRRKLSQNKCVHSITCFPDIHFALFSSTVSFNFLVFQVIPYSLSLPWALLFFLMHFCSNV